MKKVLIIISIIITTTFLTSCWSRREIDQLGFVMGLGISKTEAGLYSVVVQVANPRALVAEGVVGKEIYTIMSSEGLTVFDALRNISMVAMRRLYIAHIKSIIIDESIAKEGLSEVIGFLVQDMEIRMEMDVFIGNTDPIEIFNVPNFVGIVPARGLSIMANNFGANNKIYVADLHETLEAVNNPVINYVTTLVEIIQAPAEIEGTELKLSKIAIFDSDRLKGYLDYEEGQAYNLITNNFKNGLFVFEYAETNEKITIEGLESKASIIPTYKNERVGFNIELKVKGNIAERMSNKNIPHQLDIEILQNQLNQVLEDKLNKAISNAQQIHEVDYFNLSKQFFIKYPKEFKEFQENWNQVFANSDITVNVDSSLIHSALSLNRGRI